MPLAISCPVCGLSGEVPDGSPAGEGQCPRCGANFVVPGVEGSATEVNGAAPINLLSDYFAQFGDQVAGPKEAAAPTEPAVLPPQAPLPTPGDVAAEIAWLQEEKARFEDYIAKQFSALQRKREELAAWQTQVEGTLVSREQEVSRKTRIARSRVESLEQREREVAERMQSFEARERELRNLEEERADLEKEVVAQREQMKELNLEVTAREQEAKAIRTECLRLDTARRQRQRTWERELAEHKERRRTIEDREAQVDKAAAALERRAREIEELELLIRQELERKEQALLGSSPASDDSASPLG